MPSLETLKKQAKQYLRWHKDRYYPVAAIIRSLLPKFGALTDQEILGSPFKLADAQELVAKRNGFEGWQALKTGLEPMTRSPTLAIKPMLLTALPQIPATDIETTRNFYSQKLGFKVVILYGE